MSAMSPVRRDITEPSIITQQPRFEGANIGVAIGFKHVLYLLEEAVIQHFRECGFGPRLLFEQYGLCLEIVSSRARLSQVVYLDDVASIEITPARSDTEQGVSFALKMFLDRNGARVKSVTGTVQVVLRLDPNGDSAEAPPAELASFVTQEIHRPSQAPPATLGTDLHVGFQEEELLQHLAPAGSNTVVWKDRIPYFYCHYNRRMQHSGYVRVMEAIVDRFLYDRGISIRTMLERSRWIPVVVEARVEMLREALMEETLYTVYRVENILKDITYTARMDCYVVRDGELIQSATGSITHGYGQLEGRSGGMLVTFDSTTLAALQPDRGRS
jgi:acyl-CoA thioesterase FadM